MATPQDAELILKLYELRTEPVMREARRFVGSFNPMSFDILAELHRDSASTNNAYWRQALSYWEMACALVLHGALDADLFIAANGEPIFYYAKFTPFLEEFKKTFGQPFMRNTAELIRKSPAAAQRYTPPWRGCRKVVVDAYGGFEGQHRLFSNHRLALFPW